MIRSWYLKSAFQKDIRRCKENTLHVTKILSLRDQEPWLWRRMEIIGSEDIGIACPTIQTYIRKQKRAYDEEFEKWNKRHILMNAVNYLVKQNKSRLCDNINHAYFKDNQPEIDTQDTGEMMKLFIEGIEKKDRDMALRYASHLFKKEKEHDLISVLQYPEDEHTVILIRLFNKYNSKIRNKTDVLLLAHLILYRTMDISKINTVEVTPLSMKEVKKIYCSRKQPKLGDYVYDYHGKIGRSMGRGYKHFYEHGAKLNQCYIPDPYEPIAKSNNIKKDKNREKETYIEDDLSVYRKP